jgi:hypothetical protein
MSGIPSVEKITEPRIGVVLFWRNIEFGRKCNLREAELEALCVEFVEVILHSPRGFSQRRCSI